MKIKILAVDFPLIGSDVTAGSFYNANSFSDYDVLVIDPADISKTWEDSIRPHSDGSLDTAFSVDGGFGKYLLAVMETRKRETKLLLNVTGGIVICFIRSSGKPLKLFDSDSYPRSSKGRIHSYSWLPQDIGFSYCRGREVGEINMQHPFSRYFIEFKDEVCFEATVDALEFWQTIAKNKVGETIAVEVSFGQGKLIFLPPPVKFEDRQRISAVMMDCIHGSLGWVLPLVKPDWIDGYKVPGELKVKRQIEKVEAKMGELKKELDEEHERLRNLEMIKSLLYGQGKYVLEPAVRQAFRLLGFNVLEPEEYDGNYDIYALEEDLVVIGGGCLEIGD